MTIDYIPA